MSALNSNDASHYLELLDSLRALQNAIEPGKDPTVDEFFALLASIRGRIAERFRAEEESHCFEDLSDDQPRLSRAVENLLAEHQKLIAAIDQAIDTVRRSHHVSAVVRFDLLRWISQVLGHETREDLLLQEAYNEEPGAAD
jgi:hypothetical protein